jgi:tetratricopeptide (TPR) repeat protein
MNKNDRQASPGGTAIPGHARTGRLRLCIAAMAVALVLFAGAIGAGFHWDDELLFNSWLPYLEGPQSVLSPPREIPHFTFQYFRPLVLISYLADERLAAGLFSEEARETGRRIFFHLTPVLLHVACTGLVFLLGVRLLRRPGLRDEHAGWTAFAAAVLFATHPIHVESVAWIVGRSDSICTLLGLGTLLALLDWRERRRWPSLLAAGLLFFLALLGKETALGILLPATVIAAAWTRQGERRGMSPRAAHTAEMACLVVVLALYALLRAAYGTDPGAGYDLAASGAAWLRLTGAFGWYVAKTLWPYPQAVFPPEDFGAAMIGVGVVAAVAVVAGFVATRGAEWRSERGALALALGGVAVPLAVALTPLSTSPVAERYLYLPSAGGCLLFAFLVARVTRHRSIAGLARMPIVVLLAAVVAVPWGWTSSRRLGLWDDPLRFWSKAAETAPDSPVVFINLGQVLTAAGRFSEAGEAYGRAAELASAPDQSAMARANLGSLELRQGRFDEAVRQFALALADNPRDATSLFNWASALAMQERIEPSPLARGALRDEAVQRLEAALALHPRYAKAHLLLGTILLRKGDPERARARLETAAAIDPASAEARRARELLAEAPFTPR